MSAIVDAIFGGGPQAPAPDPNIGAAAQANAAVAKDALEFNKKVYEENKPRQAMIDELSKKIVDQQVAVGDVNQKQAQSQWDRFQSQFVPVEDQMVKDSMTIDNEANQETAAGDAGAQVSKSYQLAKGSMARNLASMGINPNSGRYLAATNSNDLMEAADKANAMNNARQIVRDKGIALRAGAANFGRNMPNTAAGAYGLTLNAGNNAVGNSSAGMNAANSNAAQMNSGFGTSIQGNNSAGQILNNQYSTNAGIYGTQVQKANNDFKNQMQLAGSIGGGIGNYQKTGSAF